jgi:hypothetical protein
MRGPWIAAAVLVAAGAAAPGGATLATSGTAEHADAIRQEAAARLRERGEAPVVDRDARRELCMNGACVAAVCEGPECAPAPAAAAPPAAPGPGPSAPTAVPAPAAAPAPGAAAPPAPAPEAAAPVRAGAARALLARRRVVVALESDRATVVTVVVRASWTARGGGRRELVLARRRVALAAGEARSLRLRAAPHALRRLAGGRSIRIRVTARGAMRAQVVLRPRP